jgi:hypothetical protein
MNNSDILYQRLHKQKLSASEFETQSVMIVFKPSRDLTKSERLAIVRAADQYAAFVELLPQIAFESPESIR